MEKHNRHITEAEEMHRRIINDKCVERLHKELFYANCMLRPVIVVKDGKSEMKYPEDYCNNAVWLKVIKSIEQQIEDRKNFIINGYE